MMVSLMGALLLAAAPMKIAMSPIQVGEGLNDKIAATVAEQIVAEIRRTTEAQVVAPDDIKATLSLEEQKQMVGCSNESCMAEVGGALGVDHMITGSIGKVGESWIVVLKLMNVKKVVNEGQSDRRLRKGSIDDVLDAIPSMVKDLFAKFPNARHEVSAAAAVPLADPAPAITKTATPEKAVPAAQAPSPVKDTPFTEKLENPLLLGDGADHYLIVGQGGNRSGPLFAGDGKKFYEQRIISSSRNGADNSLGFWDPRYFSGADRSFDYRDGKYTLTCGRKTIVFKPSDKLKISQVSLHQPRWHRATATLAVDATGVYYYVDRGRGETDSDDYHLFIGKRGHLEFVAVDDAPPGTGSRAFITSRGTLTVTSDPASAAWGEHRLTVMNLDMQAAFVYTKLGVYGVEKLATACDPYQ